jgi:Flp pilus assembly protein TadG
VRPVNSSRRISPNRQRGVAAVELAIILPLFGILLLGTLEIGGMARDHQVLQNAAREGARLSAMKSNEGNEAEIKNRIIAYLAEERITTVVAGDIDVNQDFSIMVGALAIDASKITVVYRRPLLFPGIIRWVPLGGITLQGDAVFRNFY